MTDDTEEGGTHDDDDDVAATPLFARRPGGASKRQHNNHGHSMAYTPHAYDSDDEERAWVYQANGAERVVPVGLVETMGFERRSRRGR